MAAIYFSKLPRVNYSFKINNEIQTHEMAGLWFKHILSYKQSKDLSDLYKFSWVENLRPDTFAGKYYGTDELYWLGLFSAGIYDIHNELPKNDNQMMQYLFLKYKEDERFIQFCSTNNVPQDIDSLYLFASATPNHYEDSDGDVVDQGTQNSTIVTIIDYEMKQNEDKRYVNIIDNFYAPQLRTEFDNAMTNLQAELKNVK